MKRHQIHTPPDFVKIEGKLRAVEESLDGLLLGTENFARSGLPNDLIELVASLTASVVVLHQVVGQMLKEQDQT